ncbi:MAG: hypothetical protein NDJ89_16940 [Oligoflexia bacterium]|nr:hypothetical protein [Oligoflexia bacterium]
MKQVLKIREMWRAYRWTLLALCAFGAVGGLNAYHLARGERREFVDQNVSELTNVLASQVRGELEQLLRALSEEAEGKLRPRLASGETEALPGALDRDVMEISLWTRSDPTAAPRRAAIVVNSEHLTPAQVTQVETQVFVTRSSELALKAFQGQALIAPSPLFEGGSALWVALPIGTGSEPLEVLTAHLRPSRLQRAFRWESSVRAFLVSTDGAVLAHSGFKLSEAGGLRENMSAHPLVQPLRQDQGAGGGGTMEFRDSRGARQFGGYRILGQGRLAVIVLSPDLEVVLDVGGEAYFSIFLVLLAFVAGAVLPRVRGGALPFGTGLATLLDRPSAPSDTAFEPSLGLPAAIEALPATGSAPVAASAPPEEASTLQIPKERMVTILCGSVFQVEELVRSLGPEVAVTALNEFLTLAASRVKEFGGEFEKEGGSSFVAIWRRRAEGGSETVPALRCALELRREFHRFNELRKTDGEKPLALGMGVDSGLALAGKIGPASEGKFSVVGDVLNRARKLDQLSTRARTDLLLSEDAWDGVKDLFLGTPAGEELLSPDSGLKSLFSIEGYRDGEGHEVRVASSFVASEVAVSGRDVKPLGGERGWLVNNGSQIVGPLSATELATRLFAQELDFDCECWADGTGVPARISSSGVFGDPGSEGAELWVFEAGTIHGPMTEAFLASAIARGALSADSFVCERSTVLGWKKIGEWIAGRALTAEAAPMETGEAPGIADSVGADLSGTVLESVEPISPESEEKTDWRMTG